MLFRRIQFKGEFTAGELKEYHFSDKSFSYFGEIVEQVFNEMTIYNKTNGDLFYSIERDPTDSLNIDDTDSQGTMPIPRQGQAIECTEEIVRLRVRPVSQGDVYFAIYFTQRR